MPLLPLQWRSCQSSFVLVLLQTKKFNTIIVNSIVPKVMQHTGMPLPLCPVISYSEETNKCFSLYVCVVKRASVFNSDNTFALAHVHG